MRKSSGLSWIMTVLPRISFTVKRPGQHRKLRSPIAGKQRRQVARMARVRTAAGVIMPPAIGKACPTAVSAFVDVKGEKARLCVRQAAHVGNDHCAAATGEKPDGPMQERIRFAAADMRNRGRCSVVCHSESPRLRLCGGNILRSGVKEALNQSSAAGQRLIQSFPKNVSADRGERRFLHFFAHSPRLRR